MKKLTRLIGRVVKVLYKALNSMVPIAPIVIVLVLALVGLSACLTQADKPTVPPEYCHNSDGWCVASCDPFNDGFIAGAEDEPCWLLQSPFSNVSIPSGGEDYRVALLPPCDETKPMATWPNCTIVGLIYNTGGELFNPAS